MATTGIRTFLIMAVALAGAAFTAVSASAQPIGIAATVNDDVISSMDVQQRIAFAMTSTDISDTPEMRERLWAQMLRQLIDERLQLQEAERLGITVTEDEVAGAFANVNQQRQLPPGSFQRFLEEHNVPLATVQDQMRAQIAWTKVVMQSLRRKVKITDEDIKREQERALAGQNISEKQISSIVLAVEKPEDEPQVRDLAKKLAGEIADGANFHALARQFSEGGADIVEANQNRWVQPHQLEPVLARVINSLKQGEVSPPIRTLSGYHLIKLHDSRSMNTSDVLDSEMLLKQITMRLQPDAEQQEAEVLLDIAREVAKHPGQCHENQVAGVDGLDDLAFEVNFQRVQFRNILPNLQSMLANLRVGDVSEPFATPEGIHIIQLCERIDMPKQAPAAELVREKLFREKVELEAAKHLRDLRREAFIDIRE